MVRGPFGERADAHVPTTRTPSAQLQLVKAIAPQVTGRYQVVASSGNSNVQVIATTTSYARGAQRDRSRAAPSSPTSRWTDASKVAVLGYQAATDLFGDPADGGTDPIGQTIRIKSSKFTVIGVAAEKGGTGLRQRRRRHLRAAHHGPEAAGRTDQVPVAASASRRSTQDSMTQLRDRYHQPAARAARHQRLRPRPTSR